MLLRELPGVYSQTDGGVQEPLLYAWVSIVIPQPRLESVKGRCALRNRGPDSEREERRGVGGLRRILPFVAPYKWTVVGAGLALVVAAGSVLAIGQAIRRVIDNGFGGACMASMINHL